MDANPLDDSTLVGEGGRTPKVSFLRKVRCQNSTNIRKPTHTTGQQPKRENGPAKKFKHHREKDIGASGWTALDGLKSNSFHPPLCIPQQTDPKWVGGWPVFLKLRPFFSLITHTPVLVLRVEWISIFLTFLQCRPFSIHHPYKLCANLNCVIITRGGEDRNSCVLIRSSRDGPAADEPKADGESPNRPPVYINETISTFFQFQLETNKYIDGWPQHWIFISCPAFARFLPVFCPALSSKGKLWRLNDSFSEWKQQPSSSIGEK
jgi:hypothetical protein